MIFGYNTDVKAGETVYHVQTEDRGEKNPVIDSVIYVKGQIIDRKRTPYLPGETTAERLQDMVKQQHRGLVESIRNGTYIAPEHAPAAGASRGAAPAVQATASAPPPASGSGQHWDHLMGEDDSAVLSLELINPREIEQETHLVFRLRVQKGGQPVATTVQAVLNPGGGEVRRESKASADGIAEIVFEMPVPESSVVLFRATAGEREELLKFRLARA